MKLPVRRFVIAVFFVFSIGFMLTTSMVSAGFDPLPYDPDPTESDVGSDSGVDVIRECDGVSIDGTPTILFSTSSLMYYAPSFNANTGIILPPGTTYRLLSTLVVTQTDAVSGESESFTWYEIDGPCPAGSGMTLWFPEGTPFSVIAQN